MQSILIALTFVAILLAPCIAAFSSDIFPLRVRIPLPSRARSRRTLQPELAPALEESFPSIADPLTAKAQQNLFTSRAA